MRKSISAPPVLAPLAGGLMFDGGGEQYDPETSRQCVYFPVDVDVDSLVDWKQVTVCQVSLAQVGLLCWET